MEFTQFAGTELPARKDGWSGALKVRFLDHLASKGTVRAACAAVGMSPEAAYRLRRRDGLFARGWAAALVLAREVSSDELACRALDGIEEDIWYRGELVGTRRKYDTRLLLAHLARLDRMVEECSDEDPHKGDAARFDELLASLCDQDRPCDEDRPGSPGKDLPPEREDFIIEARGRAWQEAFHRTPVREGANPADSEPDPIWDEEDGDGYYSEESCELREEAADQAGEEAALEAAACWDDWFARGCAAVDAACAPPPPPRRLRGSASLLSTVSTLSTSGGIGDGAIGQNQNRSA
ncbi:hypothetical protein H0274_05190 [Altererythrobacter sp. CC-YST694]|uniref:hypothetical protein n=1 Tax=Altererythrobacter sp. CC-YST694 TaxID=2755038 RepID=UPI001D0253F9|nr:hypothetical protein [Altererythrobacter sp. CC-YST694]MCB5424645.1 hypothetical protein [Altererythrobacter sp. CC-YST694]